MSRPPRWLAAQTRLPRWMAGLESKQNAGSLFRPAPTPLPVDIEQVPLEMRQYRAWVVWRYEHDARGHLSKPHYQPDGTKAENAEPATWSSFSSVCAAYRDRPDLWAGVGFVLSRRWGIVGVDLDHVSEHQREAERIVGLLDSYTERTPGGDGLRVFVRGTLPPGRRRRDWVEVYDSHRYLTVTGNKLEGKKSTIELHKKALQRVFWQWLGADAASIKRSEQRDSR